MFFFKSFLFCLEYCALSEFEFRAWCEKRKEEREENGLPYIYLYYTVVLSSCPEKYGANFSRIRILDENDFAFAVSVKCCRLLCFSKNALEED